MIIDQLPEISTVQDTDEIPIERGTTTYKTPLSKIWARLTAAFGSNALPNMDGTAAIGSSDKYARADHVHPHDNLIVRPNLLDNWYFVGGGSQIAYGTFPVNQRGQTSYTAAGYGIDRWKSVGTTLSCTVNSGNVLIKATAQSAQWYQVLNSQNDLAGKTVTLSALTNSGLVQTTVDVPSAIPTGTSTIGSGTTVVNGYALYVRVISGELCAVVYASSSFTSAGISLLAVKLEIGSTQTLAHQENGTWVLNEIPNYSAELDKCQHYLYPVLANNTSNGALAGGYAFNATSIRISVPVSGLAKNDPTIVFRNGSVSSLSLVSDSNALTPTAVSASFFRRGSSALLFFTVSGATTNKTYWLNSSGADFLLSAEL